MPYFIRPRLWYCDDFLASDPDERLYSQVGFICWKKVGESTDDLADFEIAVYHLEDIVLHDEEED